MAKAKKKDLEKLMKRVWKELPKHEPKYDLACEANGYTITIVSNGKGGLDCTILKLFCCDCDPKENCTECKMSTGKWGKLVSKNLASLKIKAKSKKKKKKSASAKAHDAGK